MLHTIRQPKVLIAILIVFHLIGLVGMAIPAYRADLVGLSSMNLYLALAVVLLARKKQQFSFYAFAVFCFAFGMVVEWIGVHTGWLFGNYRYGTVLGSGFMGIPWVIGVNWFVLAVCSTAVVSQFQFNRFVQVIVASLLMVGLDVLIEPVAVRLGYWSWEGNVIPFYNYVCWFLCALPLTFLAFYWRQNEQNKVHSSLYVIFIVFFVCLKQFL